MTINKNIFISFASQERDLALELKGIIDKAFNDQVSVFVSDTTITAGEIWEDEIKGAIKKAELVFVLCSPLSLKRPWVNFECGACAINKNASIILLCHSGLIGADDLMPYVDWQEAVDVHSDDFVNKVLREVKKKFEIQFTPGSYEIAYFKNRLDKQFSKESEEESKEIERPFVEIAWIGDGLLEISPCGKTETVKGNLEESKWLERVNDMYQFLANFEHGKTLQAGLAIGIQNCLFDRDDIYVGIRMKSSSDFYSSSMGVAKGIFNTGYQLLQTGGESNFKTIEAVQDLFVTMPWHIKQTVHLKSPIVENLKHRVELAGGRLWRVRLPDGQEGVASIFVNHSKRFPRFEIGIWKFIDLSSKEFSNDKRKLHCNGIIDGFGVDVFLDYRGADGVEEIPINYWVWVKDGEIFYWSYPEERLIPRKKPGKPPEKPMHAVLVTTKHMTEAYGHTVKYTPFTSDEKLRNPDTVLAERFSLPAKVLLSCF
jgi:hypothetical protein